MKWDQDDSFLDQWSLGEDWAAVALAAGHRAATLWDSIVARDTGSLARSAQVTLQVHKGKKHSALYAIVSSNVEYAVPHEFGNEQITSPGREWHQVLNMLGGA
ncbi:hypothetical protein SFC07_11045 [Corynebacterium callunae]|uniref:hypothetical protein n=1 Tax=Corynebacterium callunae TaxID=1721 RepID=UPI00398261E1